ncbi:hypothetical protein, partial [uncultured Nitrospira sp.]|uniref:hypothetical protein n=1 Tax=uncultured Nitrospira sp. TaxID=157176 RepID=UPI0031403DEB
GHNGITSYIRGLEKGDEHDGQNNLMRIVLSEITIGRRHARNIFNSSGIAIFFSTDKYRSYHLKISLKFSF